MIARLGTGFIFLLSHHRTRGISAPNFRTARQPAEPRQAGIVTLSFAGEPQRDHGTMGRRLLVFGIAAALLGCCPSAADAQYFGRNKVHYDQTDVRVLATEHFDLY